MLGVYASAAAILLVSLILGSAVLHLFGRTAPTFLAGAVGFAALTVASPLLIRLPGRAATLSILLGVILVAALVWMWRGGARPFQKDTGIAVLLAVIVIAAASLPFVFNERNGVLGEGIYTNDQGAQLFWTDWLQQDVGPEPNAVRFGYPTGPQSVAAAAAEATNASLLDAFNGLLLAIPVLTALAALAMLADLPPGRRVAAASLTGLPYLAASFLAQSAFKETAMALLVLGFAVALREVARHPPPGDRQPHPRRAMIVALILFGAASVFVYSLPGLAWFAVGVPIWLALGLATGGLRIDAAAARSAARQHRTAIVAVAIAIVAVGAFSAAQLSGFVGKVGQVQASAGRLSSPVFPGEALGIWPEGDFRVVRGEVGGAYFAVALGLLAAAIGAIAAIRRRDWGLVAMGASTVIVYAGARAFASIYVEAKALAVMSPLVVLGGLHALFSPAPIVGFHLIRARYILGGIVAVALAASTFLALRATPVGFDQRGKELEELAGLIQGRTVVFLGVDRFAGYWLRGTLMRTPGGYVPSEVRARPKKVWQQDLAMDLDTVPPRRLDQFRYAITTQAAYQSTAPPNFKPVVNTPSYVLWRRTGPTPPLRVIDKDGTPGRVLDCSTTAGRRISRRPGTATVLTEPVTGGLGSWSRSSPFDAPGTSTQTLKLPRGNWQLSLQYHSQVPLTVSARGSRVELPPSLAGMYLTSQGQGAFWPAGGLRVKRGAPVKVTVSAAEPSGLQRLLGVRRQVWLGELAATQSTGTIFVQALFERHQPLKVDEIPLRDACGSFVDHFTVRGGQASRNR
jgi:hypothetical protein